MQLLEVIFQPGTNLAGKNMDVIAGVLHQSCLSNASLWWFANAHKSTPESVVLMQRMFPQLRDYYRNLTPTFAMIIKALKKLE